MSFRDEMSFREYIREYHAVSHLILVIFLNVAVIYVFYEKYPNRTAELFNLTVPGIFRALFGLIFCIWLPIFYISKPLFEKGFLSRCLSNFSFSELFYRPPMPRNLNPKPGSNEWYELQRWLYYQDRWKDRWHYIREKLKVFGQYLGVIFIFFGLPAILALVLHKVFGVYENLALPLLCVIGFALAVSYCIGKHHGKKSHPFTESKNDDFYARRKKYQEREKDFENLEKEIDKLDAEIEEIERKSKLDENQNKGITHP
jgi:uncharacterized membrane protein YqjE